MATLYNTRISDTYEGLIKTIDNGAISATLKELSDGSGNGSGLSLNNAGDFKVNAILEFGSLKDTGENIIISKFVDAADGIGNNNNDTSIPTSKAIIDYVAGQITAEDLDFRGDDSTVLGDVDLNSEAFIILGTANEIETSVTSAGGNTLKIGIPSNPVLTGIVTATTFSGDLNGTINTATTAVTQSSGDNSTKIATTAYVDTLDAASDLDFSGDSGSGDVNLNTEVFAITGTTNQIITAANLTGLSLSLPSTVHRNLEGNVVGNLTGNVTGNVAGDLTGNVTATSVLADGVTASTQASSDNSTKVATTAYVKGLDNASDLDITDGTTAGDVNLNTQSLSILGTSSQVVSTVSNQSVTLSLPSSINVNSASATILQNARDISLTGEASGTISGFNGSANVSGAVALDNDSVTGKVLTGLASPTATNILASDSILEAFGKTQSQLNTLAGGLRFMGTWDATNNTPTLASGGGEADSGTTTTFATNKLVDSGQNFTSTVTNGDQVVNQASGATALVTNVDSNTQLTLDADIMSINQAYTIDNSPFLQQGHYFVVSVGGTSSLNGLTNWAVGDWVIAGAGNVWEKLDHTQVDGTGTAGNITKWSSTNVIADSIMAETGSGSSALVTATGSIAATQLLSSGGNFAVNTNKFTANATTGNVAVAGTLDVTGITTLNGQANVGSVVPRIDSTFSLGSNSLRFASIYGDGLTITNNATFGGDITSNNITAPAGFLGGSNGGLRIHSGGTKFFNITAANVAQDGVMDIGASDSRFKDLYLSGSITSGGGATFAGNVTANGDIIIDNSSGDPFLKIKTAAQEYVIRIDQSDSEKLQIRDVTSGVNALTIDTSSNATFAGDITIGGKTYPKLLLNDNQGVARSFSVGTDNETFTVRNETGSADVFTIAGADNAATFAGNVNIIKTTSDAAGELKIGGILASDNLPFGKINFANTAAANSQTNDVLAYIAGEKTGSSNRGELTFATSNDSSPVERLRIDSSGTTTITNGTNDNTLLLLNGARGRRLRFQEHNIGDGGIEITSQDTSESGTTNLNNRTILLNKSGGNIGIGTYPNANSTLHIANPNADTTRFTLSAESNTANFSYIKSVDNTSNTNKMIFGNTYGYNTETDILTLFNGMAGIGATPTKKLTVNAGTTSGGGINVTGSSSPAIYIDETSGPVNSSFQNDGAGSYLGTSTSHPMIFRTANTEKMRIDTSGNLSLGTVTPFYATGDGDLAQISVNRVPSSGVITNTSRSAAYVNINGSDGGSSFTFHTANANNTQPSERIRITSGGNLQMKNDTFLSWYTGAGSEVENLGIEGSDATGTMKFYTEAVERMRITSGGYSKFSNNGSYQDLTGSYYEFNSSSVSANVNITNSNAGGSCLFLQSNSSNTSQYFIYGYGNSAEKFIIWTNGTFESAGNQRFGAGPAHGNSSSPGITTRANTTKGIYWNADGSGGWGGGNFTTNNSDRNMKTNIVPMDINALKIIDSLETKYFNWTEKANRGDTSIRKAGIIAQDLKELMPEGVYGTEWKDDNKESNGLSLDENATTALLIKAIQELKAEVDLLKQECKCK